MKFLVFAALVLFTAGIFAGDFVTVQDTADNEGGTYTVIENDGEEYHTGLIIPDGEPIYKMPELFQVAGDFLKARLAQATLEEEKQTISSLLGILRESGVIGISADAKSEKVGFFEPGLVYFADPGLKPAIAYETDDRNLALGICRYFDQVNRKTFPDYKYMDCLAVAVHDVSLACSDTISEECVEYMVQINYSTLMKDLETEEEVEDTFRGSFKEGLFITDIQAE